MRTFSSLKIILILVLIFIILRLGQFANLSELSLPHDAAHYLLLGKSLAEGKGFTSESVWAISLRPDSIPFPDFYRSPGLPLLYALAFKVLGTDFWSAKLLTIVLAAGILLFSFLWGLKILEKKNLAFLASLLLFLSPVFYDWSGQFLAELPYGLFSLITLCLLFSSKGKKTLLIGLFWGLTYLCRYQALFLLGLPILVFMALEHGFKKAIRPFLLIAFYFLLTVSPWLWRNLELAGDPFYSDLKYHLAAVYQNNFSQYFFGLEHPSEAIRVFMTRSLYVASYFFRSAYQLLLQSPSGLFGNLVLFFLSVFGAISLWGKEKKITFSVLWYFFLNLFFFSFSLPETRYLFPLLPLALIFSVAGIKFLWEGAKAKKENLATLFVWLYILVFLGLFYYLNLLLLKGYRLDSKKGLLLEACLAILVFFGLRYRKNVSDISRRILLVFLVIVIGGQFLLFLPKSFSYLPHPTALEAYNSARTIQKLNLPEDAVFMTGGMPYYFEYYLNRPVIQFPYYEKPSQFEGIVKQYQVKYFIITKTQREFYPWLSGLMPKDLVRIGGEADLDIYVQK